MTIARLAVLDRLGALQRGQSLKWRQGGEAVMPGCRGRYAGQATGRGWRGIGFAHIVDGRNFVREVLSEGVVVRLDEILAFDRAFGRVLAGQRRRGGLRECDGGLLRPKGYGRVDGLRGFRRGEEARCV